MIEVTVVATGEGFGMDEEDAIIGFFEDLNLVVLAIQEEEVN